MRNVWDSARRRMTEVLLRPGNLIVSVGLAILLGVLAAPARGDPAPLRLALSGRLFLLGTGLAGVFGYAFSASRRATPEVATDEIVSLRGWVLGRILAATLLAGGVVWVASVLTLGTTFVRHRTLTLPEGWILAYASVGVLVIAGAFSGAITMARLLLRRGGRTVVTWILFLPWMLTFAAFRALGRLPADASRIVLLSLLSGVALCAVEAGLFVRFIPNRLTMRPQ
jgi:hypothetical protein